MNTQERVAILSKLGLVIADKLHSTYGLEFVTPEEDAYSVYMVQKYTGARVYLQLAHSVGYDKNDRVEVSGWLHLGKNGQYVEVYERGADGQVGTVTRVPSITVALSRGAEAIAKDIAKRFLPEYLRIFALAVAKVEADEAYELRITNTLERMSRAAGFTIRPSSSYYRDLQQELRGEIGNVDVRIKAYDGRVELKLDDLTTTQAESVIAHLQHILLVDTKGEHHGN